VPARFGAPTVFIHYYDWYGSPPLSPTYGHWDGGNRNRPDPSQNITSASYPVLGAYDSSSASVIRQHMAWIKAAHVDVVSLDWWGQGSREDRLARAVMDGAAAQGLKVNFVIDTYVGETPASIGSDIAYIYRKYGRHPAFYRASRPTKYGPSKSLRGLFMLYNPPSPGLHYSEYAKLMDGIRGTADDAIVLIRTDDSLLYSDTNLRRYLSALHFDGMFNYVDLRQGRLPTSAASVKRLHPDVLGSARIRQQPRIGHPQPRQDSAQQRELLRRGLVDVNRQTTGMDRGRQLQRMARDNSNRTCPPLQLRRLPVSRL
jgi:hypothetical protein